MITRLYFHADPGDPHVSLNPGSGSGSPFAVIYFGGRVADMTFSDPAEARKYAAAFTRAAELLECCHPPAACGNPDHKTGVIDCPGGAS